MQKGMFSKLRELEKKCWDYLRLGGGRKSL